jgi:predicted ABC-type transport system involved in lysophospholipase L1 biosynthesis ATPase subunit
MPLLAFEHVSKSYRDGRRERVVLDDVSFEIDAGDFVGIWGMRRSGKSTLLRLAGGLELADEGAVRFDGLDLGRSSGQARAQALRENGIGLVLTDRRPALNQRALETVALPLLAAGSSLRDARLPALRALERTGALACAESSIAALARDDLIRVMLAQALVHAPRLLLVDEPAAFLNMREAAEIFSLLHSIGGEGDLTLVLASEDLRPLRRARAIMSVGGGEVHLMERGAEVVQFPGPDSARRGGHGR